jgi:hypothetical protein
LTNRLASLESWGGSLSRMPWAPRVTRRDLFEEQLPRWIDLPSWRLSPWQVWIGYCLIPFDFVFKMKWLFNIYLNNGQSRLNP